MAWLTKSESTKNRNMWQRFPELSEATSLGQAVRLVQTQLTRPVRLARGGRGEMRIAWHM